MSRVIIHTDGACSGNPGPGGWGAIIRDGDKITEMKGGEPATTNNRMELLAAISALEALARRHAGGIAHRLAISPRRHHAVDAKLEEKRLAHQRQEAGQERRSVEAVGGRRRAPPGRLALGARPCRARRERARRRARRARACSRFSSASSGAPLALPRIHRRIRAREHGFDRVAGHEHGEAGGKTELEALAGLLERRSRDQILDRARLRLGLVRAQIPQAAPRSRRRRCARPRRRRAHAPKSTAPGGRAPNRPAAWPWRSFTALKPSRSRNRSAAVAP